MSSSYDTDSDLDSLPPNPNRTARHLDPKCKTLLIMSYGHRRGPLVITPPPSLTIDLRKLPNPPKNIRDNHTGDSGALRDWLVKDEEFQAKLEDTYAKIQDILKEKRVDEIVKVDETEEEGKQANAEEDEEEGDQDSHIDDSDDGESEQDDENEGRIVSIGIRCELGRHLSVAFAEELGKKKFDGWEMVVQHRDLGLTWKDSARRKNRGPD
ncbi:hypothetical protein BDQ12DRAFT_685260 [Crucibulum laeve]|uniref:RapZ C-terminal domain-containing protein n=1 Tax=Crucibulum laeve TaxID=68775 RepID=A0A5C3LY88_9AGAR|nr:hypothetical protein BDQ12DRAFT_685260 [Crucibulum laeve]